MSPADERAGPLRALLAPALAALAGGAAVGLDVAADGLLARADGPVHARVVAVRPEALVRSALAVTATGGWAGRLALSAAVALPVAAVLPPRRRVRALLPLALVQVLAPTASASLKRLVDRPRPPAAQMLVHETDPSFPSGHATGSAALAVGLAAALLATPPGRSAAGRAGAVAVPACWSLAVGATRVELGAHWPTDVLAGWCLGAAVGLATTAVVALRARRR